jgi:hypothetical protein
MRPYVDAISHREAWSDDSSIKGILCDGNKITWKLRCVSEYNRNSIPARYYEFHARCKGRLACTGHNKIPWDSDLFNVCLKEQPALLRKCTNAARLRTNKLSKDTRNDIIAATSPSLQAKKIEILTAENKRLQKIVRKARQKLAQMNEKEQGIFTANVDHNQVFGEDLRGFAAEYFDNKDISQEDLTRVVLT